jgi:release factor glutamine methyltransferase
MFTNINRSGWEPVDEQSFRSAQEMLQKMSEDTEQPTEFTLLNREWDLMAGVFAPIYTPAPELFSTWIPYPVNGTFLEMGSGAGVTAVVAALSAVAP